jgi:EmrB/QacA subfamily drug resistance transporter
MAGVTTSAPCRGDEEAIARRRRYLVLAIASMSLLIVNIDATALSVALPAIQRGFSASLASLQWVTDAYVLVISVLMLAAGSAGDRVGRRRVFRFGLVIFLLGSLACSLSANVDELIVFRMLQAVGGSMLNPNALSIITNTFSDRQERARALGWWSATYGIALALGPILGGALVDSLGWRWVFWINLPVGLAALVLTSLFIPDSRAPHARRIDPAGQVLVVASLGSLTYAIIEGPSAGWTSGEILGLLGAAALSLVIFVLVERRVGEPLVDMRFFKSPPFSAAAVAATLTFLIMGGFLFVNSLYLQDVRGASALMTGVALLPATVFIGALSPVAGRMVGRYGPRLPLVLGGLGNAAGTAVLAYSDAHSSYALLLVAYSLIGIGMGFVNPPITTTALSGMPASQAGVAGGIAASTRQVGTVLGIALLGSLLADGLASRLRQQLAPLHLARRTMSLLIASGSGAAEQASHLRGPHGRAAAAIARIAFAQAAHAPWWLATAAGLVIAIVAFVSAGPRGIAAAGRVFVGEANKAAKHSR